MVVVGRRETLSIMTESLLFGFTEFQMILTSRLKRLNLAKLLSLGKP
jgi:hypothetical protein